MSSTTPYSVRWKGPALLPYGRGWDVSVSLEHGDASPTVSSATFTLYSPDGSAIVDAEAAVISSGTLTYTVASSVLASTDVGPRWLVKFEATIGSTILPLYNDAAVCLAPLFCPVGITDLTNRLSKLGDLQSATADLQPFITDAWTALTQKLYSDAVPFWRMRTPGALRPWLLAKSLSLALDDLALLIDTDSKYSEEAQRHRDSLSVLYSDIKSLMDESEDNTPSTSHEGASPVVILGSNRIGGGRRRR